MYGLPYNVCAVHVVPVSVYMLLPYICLWFLYVRSYPLIYVFESWITGVSSSYVVFLCDCAYYALGYELAIAMHLSLWYVVLVCHPYNISGYGGP